MFQPPKYKAMAIFSAVTMAMGSLGMLIAIEPGRGLIPVAKYMLYGGLANASLAYIYGAVRKVGEKLCISSRTDIRGEGRQRKPVFAAKQILSTERSIQC